MNRRFFIKFLLSLGFGAYFPKLAEAARFEKLYEPQDGFKPLTAVKFLRQVVTKNSATSRMIMWDSKSEIKNVRLKYFLDGENFSNFGDVSYEYFESDGGENFIYFCELKNLLPKSLYRFRIISENAATAWQNLRTADEENFQMLVFSDSQCANYKVWQKVADTAHENFPDAELVTVIGDLVDNGQANYQWRAWKNSAAFLLSERIFAPVMGNHECYNLSWKNSLPTIYLQNFKVPASEKNFDGYFYSFDFGAANFFVLNNNFLELDEFKPDMKKIQRDWFVHAAENSNRRWKIVLMHKDIFDYANDKFENFAEDFMKLFDELKIDLVLTGHLHTYRNRGKIFAQKKSARGTVYVLCGRAGDQKYIENISEFDEVTAPDVQNETESFITLDVGKENLILTCYSVDGKIWDKFELKKILTNSGN